MAHRQPAVAGAAADHRLHRRPDPRCLAGRGPEQPARGGGAAARGRPLLPLADLRGGAAALPGADRLRRLGRHAGPARCGPSWCWPTWPAPPRAWASTPATNSATSTPRSKSGWPSWCWRCRPTATSASSTTAATTALSPRPRTMPARAWARASTASRCANCPAACGAPGRWKAERLRREGRGAWSPHNEMLQSYAITLLLQGTLIAFFGWKMVAFLADPQPRRLVAADQRQLCRALRPAAPEGARRPGTSAASRTIRGTPTTPTPTWCCSSSSGTATTMPTPRGATRACAISPTCRSCPAAISACSRWPMCRACGSG